MTTSNVVTAVFDVFSNISTWFTGSISDFVDLFYTAENGLSFIGIMALIGIGIGVTRMLFAIITSFVQMRGGK